MAHVYFNTLSHFVLYHRPRPVEHHCSLPVCDYFWHVQVLLLGMPSLAKGVVLFSWSMYAAVALMNPCWTVPIMDLAIPLVATMKTLELFVKVRDKCMFQ